MKLQSQSIRGFKWTRPMAMLDGLGDRGWCPASGLTRHWNYLRSQLYKDVRNKYYVYQNGATKIKAPEIWIDVACGWREKDGISCSDPHEFETTKTACQDLIHAVTLKDLNMEEKNGKSIAKSSDLISTLMYNQWTYVLAKRMNCCTCTGSGIIIVGPKTSSERIYHRHHQDSNRNKSPPPGWKQTIRRNCCMKKHFY